MSDRAMTVREAMGLEDRRGFLPPEYQAHAAEDRPLPIGSGGTNSQPTTVLRMLELLDVHPGHRVLDIGSGSGWTTAVLSRLVGESGTVIGVELEPALVSMGRENLGIRANARIEEAHDGVFGWPQAAPYDRILVSAMAEELPADLIDQLADGGLVVVPIDGVMTLVRKDRGGVTTSEHGLYRFVPLRRHT
ncbi:protein-L-isoaspartate O-methyltransferase [Blastococcus sp. Marseille-P5729]|uniref:protein-L-isoaspartate O-methyltransferase family protein n=1 Tax=Blastococcus sp. Marseille-P5729 TaxID=2086582 RepID=UPI0018FEE10A|nr:methyltransferase domain-containing protein [Blastococcus sp. Marseille-P5729]